MEFTCELSKLYTMSPFDILSQDKDGVIMLINYYIEKGQTEGENNASLNDLRENDKKTDNAAFWALI